MYTIKTIDNQAVWEKFLKTSAQVNFLHSFYWGEFHKRLDHPVFRRGIYQKGKLVGLFLLIKIEAKRGTYFECPGGPIFDWDNLEILQAVINNVRQLAIEEKAAFLRIRPNVSQTDKKLADLRKSGFRKAPMHLHAESTWVIDLSLSLNQLLSNMRKNTRYAIRLAEKKGVTIEVSEDISDVKLLYDLQLETSSRHGFVPFSLKYLEAQFFAFNQNHQIQLFKAKYQDRLLAISFIIFYGQEAVYHYSGSSEESRTIPASYLLQWEVIKAAKERGMKRYNLWGVNQSGRSDHRFAGVTLFKTGFGGEALNYLSAHDLMFSKRYFITYLIEAWRRKVRHL